MGVTTVTALVTDAYYLSGVVSEDFSTVTGKEVKKGVRLLNELLAFQSADDRMIPYFKEHAFEFEAGEQKYHIDGLVLAETLTYTIANVQYSVYPVTSREAFFGLPRVNVTGTLPFAWHFERSLGGADIYIYNPPNDAYDAKLWGKFSLAEVQLNEDLQLTLDKYYLLYLKYALAEMICEDRNINFEPKNKAKLMKYEKTIFDISPLDLSIKKISGFPRSNDDYMEGYLYTANI